ncbi:MAG: metalloregulator ArsR/SmtB family transcription factor [Propionibacteriaceae bacterium]|nr:metalloregulator ArsR/SmtB family transcription factor [Propionibacteriaceae bacterium]
MYEDTQITRLEADDDHIALAAEVFSLLSDPTRIRLILALGSGERSVGQLAQQVGKKPTAVSQHLAKLRWAKIVRTRPEASHVFYSLVDEHAAALVRHGVQQAEHVLDDRPAHHAGADSDRPA